MALEGPIIVIEDDHDDLEVIRDILQQTELRNEVIMFDSGNEAFNFLVTTDKKPFIIMCDINMPLLTGMELKEKIEKNEFLRKKTIPFIFLTTGTSSTSVKAAYEKLNVQGFFVKPTSFADFQTRLNLIIGYWKDAVPPDRE